VSHEWQRVGTDGAAGPPPVMRAPGRCRSITIADLRPGPGQGRPTCVKTDRDQARNRICPACWTLDGGRYASDVEAGPANIRATCEASYGLPVPTR
jgi:hypothetical protein